MIQYIAKIIKEEIKKFTNSQANTMKKWNGERAWGEPIVGFSIGSDPLYNFYKLDIGRFYLLPKDFLLKEYPSINFKDEDISIVSWILPQTNKTKRDQRKQTCFPSERWARSRIFGEEFNKKLRKHLVKFLNMKGVETTSPLLSTLWKRSESIKYGYASTWSERHAAYASGLGTFGLCDGLITESGKAIRVGSIITNIYIEPTKRLYKNHHEYCLFFSKDTFGKCIERCPVKAISKKGHNKILCSGHVRKTKEYVKRNYGFNGYGCGLCQTGVPCESSRP